MCEVLHDTTGALQRTFDSLVRPTSNPISNAFKKLMLEIEKQKKLNLETWEYNDPLAKNHTSMSGEKQDQYFCIVYLPPFLIIYNVLTQVYFSLREGFKN